MKNSSAVSPLAVLRGHGDSVVSLKFLNSVRSILVSGDSGGGLMMWDVHVYKAATRIAAHEKSIVSINVVNSLTIST
jgi:WD40 repeat protein